MSHGSGECSGKGPTHGHRRKIVQIKGSHNFIRGNTFQMGLQLFLQQPFTSQLQKMSREWMFGRILSNIRLGLCEGASESREFECVAQQMAVALAPQSAANLPSMHLALWLDFSRGRKKCREQIRRNSARWSSGNLSCSFDSASRCHGGSVGVVS